MQIKGLIHVHSNFSDGNLSLEEIKKRAQNMGVNFILMADHAGWLGSQEKVNKMVKKCEELSDGSFLMVPGFEVAPKKDYHILIYNCQQFINHDPSIGDLIDFPFTKEQFLVLAHASQYPGKLPSVLARKLDGVEVWNAKYDSRYAPNLKAYHCLKETDLVALAGLDAHSRAGLSKLLVEIEIENLGPREIFDSLRAKKFKIKNRFCSIDINKSFSFSQRGFFTLINCCLAPLRIPYTFLAKRGFRLPKFLHRILNKFF